MTTYEDIIVEPEVRPGVTVIRLNRPSRMNAMRFQSYAELTEALDHLETGALVITGEGRGFCSGDDVDAIFNRGEGSGVDMGDEPGLQSVAAKLLYAPYPIVAAVNGVAVGWGMELALMADLRVASSTARFAEFFVLRGQMADVASLVRLQQLVGREAATRLLLTGEMVDAPRALALGLVGEVVEPDDLLPTALDLAATLAARAPLAVTAIKEGLRRASEPDWHEFASWAAPTHARLFKTADHREAVKAFLEKREPEFTGR
jgi:enoyl-CoA hydratase/carnithine racemase